MRTSHKKTFEVMAHLHSSIITKDMLILHKFQLRVFVMTRTLEQKIAEKQAQIAVLKEKARTKDTAQKVIIGGMMLSVAKSDSAVAKQILELIETQITRKNDLDRLDSVIEDLKKNSEDTSYDTSYEDTSYEDLN